MVMLLVMGLVVLAGGLLTLLYGVPIKDFSFGNTLIIAGAMVACTGVLLLGMAFVVRELRRLSQGLTLAGVAPAPAPAVNWPAPPVAPTSPVPSPTLADERISPPPLETGSDATPIFPTRPAAPEPRLRDRPRPEPGDTVPEPIPPAQEPGKPRRSLLFVSSSRKERERERERAAEAGRDPVLPGAYSELTPPENSALPSRKEPSLLASEQRPADQPPRREAIAPARGSTRGGNDEDPQAEPHSSEPPKATVVKSGVVDGMAYSLYSDGSIEAQMPEGMMRFASIDELRAHLDRHP